MNSTSHVGNTRLLRPVVVAVEYQEDSQAENDQAKNEEEPEEPPMSQGQVNDIKNNTLADVTADVTVTGH